MRWSLLRLQPCHGEGQTEEERQNQWNQQQVHILPVPNEEPRIPAVP